MPPSGRQAGAAALHAVGIATWIQGNVLGFSAGCSMMATFLGWRSCRFIASNAKKAKLLPRSAFFFRCFEFHPKPRRHCAVSPKGHPPRHCLCAAAISVEPLVGTDLTPFHAGFQSPAPQLCSETVWQSAGHTMPPNSSSSSLRRGTLKTLSQPVPAVSGGSLLLAVHCYIGHLPRKHSPHWWTNLHFLPLQRSPGVLYL